MSETSFRGPRLYDRRRKRFWWADNEVWDDYAERIPKKRRADAMAIYSLLARHADQGGVAWPGIDYICRKVGRSRPMVRDAVKELGLVGLVGKKEKFDDEGRQLSNDYLLLDIEKGEGAGGNPVTPQEGVSTLNRSLPPSGVNPVTPKNTSPRDESSPEDGTRKDTPIKDAFTVFCSLMQLGGLEVSPEDRKAVPGNLARLWPSLKESERLGVLTRMVDARRQPISTQSPGIHHSGQHA